MTHLTQYQEAEVAEIVDEAVAVTPHFYHDHLLEAFTYLAYCYVRSRNDWHLADIQSMIDAAKADNAVALAVMSRKLNAEIAQLRGEMRSGFEKVAASLNYLADRQDALESRVEQLEQRPPTTVHVTNNVSSPRGMPVSQELLWLFAAISILSLMMLYQAINVRDAYLLQQRQEVSR